MYLKYIWIVYEDGVASVWCTNKKSAEGYRCWGRRKNKHKINIVRYEICSPHSKTKLWPTNKPAPKRWKCQG